MARKSSSTKEKKRKRVTVRLLKREHAGEVTEPYQIMERLRAAHHGNLEGAKIGIAWRLGWRADGDGHLKLGQCKKRSDLDRELDGFDFMILLNNEAWAGLTTKQREALVDHELCHAQIVLDDDGQPKKDDRGRFVCRIRKHDTEEFRIVVERHGLWTADLEEIARAAINDADRPLLKKFKAEADGAAARGVSVEFSSGGKSVTLTAETAAGAAQLLPDSIEAVGDDTDAITDEESADDESADSAEGEVVPGLADPDAWKRQPISALGMDSAVEEFIIDAGHKTIGSLSKWMEEKGQWWVKDMVVGGRRKPANFQAKVEEAFAEFWAS